MCGSAQGRACNSSRLTSARRQGHRRGAQAVHHDDDGGQGGDPQAGFIEVPAHAGLSGPVFSDGSGRAFGVTPDGVVRNDALTTCRF